MPPTRRYRPKTASELHRAWLELVDTDGPFLAIPPLKRVWPQGMPALDPDRLDALRQARPAFDHAWEALDIDPDDDTVQTKYRTVRDAWVQTVLRDVVGWRESLAWGADNVPGVTATAPDRRVTVAPDAVLRGPDGIGALVSVVDRQESLHDTGTDGWAASPIDRMEAMLRGCDVPIGIVTDGRWWALVCARKGAMVASGVVDAQTWTEEPLTRNAFLTLLARQYLIGGDPNERLPKLFEESVAAAEEITEALGAQVRRAVELLIQAFSETSVEARWRGLPDPLPDDAHHIYTAAVTAMMRVVFLLFAEERGLLPTGRLFQQGYGVSGELDALEYRERVDGEESLDSTYLTWHRLLATSQALYRGASFEDMRIPAYGGSLFDPARFPFLTATNDNGTLALPISDRVMLHVLRSVQVAQLKGGDARRISFRDIDVEQIGYIYEGLLGYTCTRATGIQVGLLGALGAEPEIPLATLEQLADIHPKPAALAAAIVGWVKEHQPAATPPSANALAKLLAAEPGEDADRQLRAVTGDDDHMRERLRRWATIIRRDLRGRPTVVLDGGLLVTETPSRRNAGAHYTPKDLAEQVVKHALEPLCYFPGPHQTADRDTWKLRHYTEILGLKVADIAAGSGAFLVAAARYLADRLVEAWIDDDPANAHDRDLHQHAIREVVARCLYGADINAMAVEMCKLSLWLVSLDRKLPFSFVDDKIFHGNSLLGLTDPRQLRHLHIAAPDTQQPRLSTLDMDGVIARAVQIRRDLASEVREHDPQRSTAAKERQLARLHNLTRQLTAAADGVIAAGLRLGGKPGKALNEAYENLAEAVAAAFPADGQPADTTFLDSIIADGLTPTVPTDYQRWQPLHWVLEVPDVLIDQGGFDAIVGNPPFLGGKKLTGTMGTDVRDWLVYQLADDTRGNADLVAYFLLRAFMLLRDTGTLGLIATNTVAQGDTREVGLDQAVRWGLTLTRAVQSASWPAASANLEYAAVWGSRGRVADAAERVADGVVVPRISTLLEPAGKVDGTPARLRENKDIAYIGCIVLGMGFALLPEEAQAWIVEDSRNCEVLFPYLIGQDLNSSPSCSPSRWVIDFNERSLEEASTYPTPFGRVEQLVRPERALNKKKSYRNRWWRFGENCPGMRNAIVGLDEVLAITRVSKSVMPMRVPTSQVLGDSVVVFATDAFADQAILSSSSHQLWAIKYGSGMRNDPRYTPSDVFETFPRPATTPLLAEVGATLDRERREIMLRRQLGLTKLYNLVNNPQLENGDDPDVARMRWIHVELDEAVLDAYGWSDVPLDHGFHTYRQMTRWTVSPTARVEILDRLLAENLRRAAEQAKTQPKAPVKAAKGRAKKTTAVDDAQGTLL
ncbi:Eco57I restriction-modification methylase domain-containing protein [Micromonospora sp. LOL_024]|uniref:Eco57I restriction-modification methylase domain-containing protein n=1 Tax=Micromonospora sp. LOL_024 TaxID=3345412 RepID=UPI003A8C00BA